MDFCYSILFLTQDGKGIEREGTGVFHPSDNTFKLEHMLWLMAEEFGRPLTITITMQFKGDYDGTETPKRLEGPTPA